MKRKKAKKNGDLSWRQRAEHAESKLLLATSTLNDIASAKPLMDGIELLRRDPATVQLDSEAFRWARNYAAGTVHRLAS